VFSFAWKLSSFRKLETVSVVPSKIPKTQTNHNEIAKSITRVQNKEGQRWKKETKSESLDFLGSSPECCVFKECFAK